MITTVPMKNAGAEMKSSEKTRAEASRARPARVAARTPSDGHRHQRELERDGIAPGQLVAHREPGDEGVTEIAAQHLAEPEEVLHGERPVQMERVDQRLPRLLVLARGDPEEDGDEVSWDQVDEQEGKQRHPEQRRDQEQEPLADVNGQRSSHACLKKCRLRLPG
jgi:predicted methyltransferase